LACPGHTGMTVVAASKNKEVAQDFLVWEHVTPKAMLYDYDLRQVYPVNKKAFDDPRLTQPVEWFGNQKVGTIIKEAADAMLPFFQGKWWPEISDGAGKHITAALKGEKSVKQALDEAQADAKAAVEAAGGKVDANGVIQG
jgi:arabinosaccharide transport system substrate-binding protein